MTDGSLAMGAGAILQLIRDGRARTRADLIELTGLARSTVAQRLDSLVDENLVVAAGEGPSTGGRPATLLAFNGSAGVVLAADLGASHAQLAVADLAGEIVATSTHVIDIARGPDVILAWLVDELTALLRASGHQARDVRCVGVGVPGPVEHATGRPISPPIMPGWDRFPIADVLGEQFGTTVLVDNDVNAMALGEAFLSAGHEPLVFVKVGTGIGLGYVVGGVVQRGAQGCAGDIGHIRTAGHDDVVCRCGNYGCLEAVAGGGALAERLTAAEVPAGDPRDVVSLVRGGNPAAIRMLRDAGREIGAVLASVVNLLNPAGIVIGGEISEAGEHLLAGIRENVYRRSTPLATHSLRIVRSSAGERAGVIGATAMCVEHVLAPAVVDRMLAQAS